MLQKDIDEVEKIFKSVLDELRKNYDIKLIYVFGSYAKGNNTKNSDLDIAVLFGDGYDYMDKLNLIGDLISIFKRDDIDLVVLNTANPVLRHQIIKFGKLIFEENEDIKVEFEVKTLREYMDMEPFRRTQMEFVKEWIENVLEGDYDKKHIGNN
ncbi:hypothetical protein EDC21_1232 [Thermohydrogenium kirishiense]|uniref:type VII toxin-antitoxin system MntA family adenylyltransferase antitoxin n=1 Tax=Thermoanaerobacterium thermosaccharolyticum TaxID=1517 RepID=UPI001046B6AE|nr:hypothetical protein EDC21_1232 [Thermohydrogenium kirishiense]